MVAASLDADAGAGMASISSRTRFGVQYAFCFFGAMIHNSTPRSVVCRGKTAAGTRNGTAVTGYLNGTSKTATLASATNLMQNSAWVFGADNSGSYHLGRIDYFRVFSALKTTTRDLSFRLLDPRASTVLMDYILTKDANSKVIDRGPYEMHAAAAGTPTTAGAVLAVNPEPVRFISVNLDTDNAPQGYVMVRNRVYPVRFF